MRALQIIIASTRPGRIGLLIAGWINSVAQKHEAFDDVRLVDLAEWNLPFMDEPHHPRLRRYEHQHTRDWAATIDQADAFVIVLPEYNYGYTAPLKTRSTTCTTNGRTSRSASSPTAESPPEPGPLR